MKLQQACMDRKEYKAHCCQKAQNHIFYYHHNITMVMVIVKERDWTPLKAYFIPI